MEIKQESEVWGEDLRTSPNKNAAIRGVKEQCERFGLGFRHRPSGWGIQAVAGETPWWWYSEDELNNLVDYVETIAQLRQAAGVGE